MLRRYWPGLVALLLVLLFLLWLRPVFHGLVMFFYTSPIVWFPPDVAKRSARDSEVNASARGIALGQLASLRRES